MYNLWIFYRLNTGTSLPGMVDGCSKNKSIVPDFFFLMKSSPTMIFDIAYNIHKQPSKKSVVYRFLPSKVQTHHQRPGDAFVSFTVAKQPSTSKVSAKDHSPRSWSRPTDRAWAYLPSTSSTRRSSSGRCYIANDVRVTSKTSPCHHKIGYIIW